MTHVCLSKQDHHWLRYWHLACSAPSHYLNQIWLIVNSTLGNMHISVKFESKYVNYIEDNELWNAIYKSAALLSRLNNVFMISSTLCWSLEIPWHSEGEGLGQIPTIHLKFQYNTDDLNNLLALNLQMSYIDFTVTTEYQDGSQCVCVCVCVCVGGGGGGGGVDIYKSWGNFRPILLLLCWNPPQ